MLQNGEGVGDDGGVDDADNEKRPDIDQIYIYVESCSISSIIRLRPLHLEHSIFHPSFHPSCFMNIDRAGLSGASATRGYREYP
jgi:hypothetical protein